MSLQKKFFQEKNTCKVTFRLPKEAAPKAKNVKILGDFNNWDSGSAPAMKLKGAEYMASLELPFGQEFQFRYLIDNEAWENDAAADKYVPSPYGVENSVVVTAIEERDDMAH